MAEDWARPLVHWEIQAKDPAKIKAFYSKMFNWEIGDGRVMNIPAGIGAPENGLAGHIMQSDTSRVVLYFQVRDLRASLVQAVELGGRVTREPMDLPNGPTIAGITDPEANPVVLVQQ
ncbi:MAG: VOC family protein [Dehalococcoidia bacterium]